ncbi:GTP-binding protein EngB [Anopheles sinensis]|uniref:GTP-binding protein EngB n=1 Tax=Anopheles sinensis TaxID=74873 RepID=A0A084WBI0_ANOSI|nr:GTP-binding protein EngB [Anopheles sinensis]
MSPVRRESRARRICPASQPPGRSQCSRFMGHRFYGIASPSHGVAPVGRVFVPPRLLGPTPTVGTESVLRVHVG